MVLPLLLMAARARSQAMPQASGPGSYVAVGIGGSGFQAQYGQQHLAGPVIYADVNPHWRVGFEGEARFLNQHGREQVTESSYLGGPRVLLLRSRRLDLYGKFLAGVGHITLPYRYAHGSFLTYASGAGVEFAATDFVSVRVLDFEYQHWPDFPFGPLNPYGLSAGVSIRLNGISRIPHLRPAR